MLHTTYIGVSTGLVYINVRTSLTYLNVEDCGCHSFVWLCQNVSNAKIKTYRYVLNKYNRAYNTYKPAYNTYNRAYNAYRYGVFI
jgi:hypothetical protein